MFFFEPPSYDILFAVQQGHESVSINIMTPSTTSWQLCQAKDLLIWALMMISFQSKLGSHLGDSGAGQDGQL